MAYGIEELSEMKVTGPVEGGDMVAKPNEMPVGAAALLSKMQKKNTPGIFKLPQADKEMPSFMKVAAEGVEEQNTANLEDSEIMRIMGQYGVGPEEARRIHDEMIYGYERDEAAIDPTDWRSILKMIESGMSQEEIDAQLAAAQFPGNFTENSQDVKTVPTNLKTRPDAPETTLAYITPEEQGVLAMLNPGTPHMGPEGIPTYDAYDYDPNTGQSTYVSGGDWKDTQSGSTVSQPQQTSYGDQMGVTLDMSKPEDRRKRQEFRDKTGSDVVTADEMGALGITDTDSKEFKKLIDAPAGGQGTMANVIDALTGVFKSDPLYQNLEDIPNIDKIIAEIDRFNTVDNKLEGLGLTSIINMLAGGPYKDKDKLWRGEEGSDIDEDEDERTLEGIKKFIKEQGGDKALESLKNLRPELYYKVVNPQTSGSIEELAGIDASKFGSRTLPDGSVNPNYNPDFANKIFAAREQASRGKDKNENRVGGSAPETEVSNVTFKENIDIDPRAGQFNVGGTMKYKDDTRTGGTEMDVPLGRRFAIDKSGKFRGNTPMGLNEAIKYATMGGYSQLEPFQEYLTRRRKELGEQPDEYFDEEGNVIYSGQA